MTLLDDVMRSRDRFDPEAVIEKHPWLATQGQDCIISPDADGQLCALFLSHVLGWNIRGFYDGKAMVCSAGVSPRDCVFVDVEIYRHGVKSFGNHMLMFNANRPPEDWDRNFAECLSMNNWRGHDRRLFRRKYPFASIHFLLAILATRHDIALPPSAAGPLLHADGTYKLLLQYTENAWDWLRYMGVDDTENPLHNLFHSGEMTVYTLMTKMLEFWRRRDELSRTGHRGDRIAITERGGEGSIVNLRGRSEGGATLYDYDNDARERNEEFLGMLGRLTGWHYGPTHWSWTGWRLYQFDKGIDSEMTNLRGFAAVLAQRPLSWAISAQNRCEFTIERTNTQSPFER